MNTKSQDLKKLIVIPAEAGTQRLQLPEWSRQRSRASSNSTTLGCRLRGNDNLFFVSASSRADAIALPTWRGEANF
jgi:hypothetical protein